MTVYWLSCIYFAENEDHWLNHLSNFNDFFSVMSEGWQNDEQESLESVRDRIRYPLSQRDPASFPYNEREGTDVYALIDQVFSSPTCQSSTEESCPHCHDMLNRSTSSSPFWHLEGKTSATISKQLQDTLNTTINKRCRTCLRQLHKTTNFQDNCTPPSLPCLY